MGDSARDISNSHTESRIVQIILLTRHLYNSERRIAFSFDVSNCNKLTTNLSKDNEEQEHKDVNQNGSKMAEF